MQPRAARQEYTSAKSPIVDMDTNTSARAKGKMPLHNVVELSSDEEDEFDDGQPESSKRNLIQSLATKRTIVIDSDDEAVATDSTTFDWFFEPARMKRQKVDHAVSENDIAHHADNHMMIDLSVGEQQMQQCDYLQIVQDPASSFDPGALRNDQSVLALRPTRSNKDVSRRPQDHEQGKCQLELAIQRRTTKIRRLRLTASPYYDDPKLESRMYCGPGYEKFPIVLGSVDEHQKACNAWDRQQARQRSKKALTAGSGLRDDVSHVTDGYDSDYTDDSDIDATEVEWLNKIREVLPDIQQDFLLKMIRDHVKTFAYSFDEDIQIQPNLTDLMSQITELQDYPRESTLISAKKPADDGTGYTIEWQQGNTGSKTYQRDAVCLLASQFEQVPTHFIHKTVQQKQTIFDAYKHIYNLEQHYQERSAKEQPYRRRPSPRVSIEKKYMVGEQDTRPYGQRENQINELQAAKQHVERERLRVLREQQHAAAEEANLKEHQANGNLIECQCCFDEDIPLNRAVACENTQIHWFCFECVQRLAENQVGSMKHEMKCMHQSGCKAKLSFGGVARAISSRLLEKLAFYQQQLEIAAACIEGLEQCPFCDFKAICDPIEITSVFQCQNPDCKRVSCRKCLEDSHLPKSCDEANNDKKISARHQVEEARSEALIRSCPRCKVKIVKEIGCNKMRCNVCGCVMCYVCKADISKVKDGGYGHFGNAGSRCSLNDNNFNRHEIETDEAERAAISKVQAENADIDEKLLQIETGMSNQQAANKRMMLRTEWNRGRHLAPVPAPPPELPPMDFMFGGDQLEAMFQQHQVQIENFNKTNIPDIRPKVAQAEKRIQNPARAPKVTANPSRMPALQTTSEHTTQHGQRHVAGQHQQQNQQITTQNSTRATMSAIQARHGGDSGMKEVSTFDPFSAPQTWRPEEIFLDADPDEQQIVAQVTGTPRYHDGHIKSNQNRPSYDFAMTLDEMEFHANLYNEAQSFSQPFINGGEFVEHLFSPLHPSNVAIPFSPMTGNHNKFKDNYSPITRDVVARVSAGTTPNPITFESALIPDHRHLPPKMNLFNLPS